MKKKVLAGREKVRVAAVQAAPIFMDREKTIEKACRLIKEAGSNGAELIAFSEAFIPTYPAFYTGGFESDSSEWQDYMIALQDNAVSIPSEDTNILGEAAQAAGVYVVMGCNELDDRLGSQTLYNTLLFLGRDGKVMGRHRKLMPTYTERTYWGWGDASDLRVFDTDIGRIGGLICWEHHMILIRAAMIHKAEEFHIAVWPGNWCFGGESMADGDTAPLGGTCDLQPAIREHAFESGAFVISVSGILTQKDFPDRWQHLTKSDHMSYSMAVGGSAIVSPFGTYMVEPTFNQEKILYADCYANQIKAIKAMFDSLGHYTRWDVVRLEVRQEGWEPVVEIGRAMETKAGKMFSEEIQRISDKFDIDPEKLQAILTELEKIRNITSTSPK